MQLIVQRLGKCATGPTRLLAPPRKGCSRASTRPLLWRFANSSYPVRARYVSFVLNHLACAHLRRITLFADYCAPTVHQNLAPIRPSSNLGAPTKCIPAYFLQLIESTVHPKLRCGILADRRAEFASPLILEISFRLNIQEYRPKERKFRNY